MPGNKKIIIDNSSMDFYEKQRSRFHMPQNRLREILKDEHCDRVNFLFGVDMRPGADIEVEADKCRFPNELAAFRAYVQAKGKLQGISNTLASMENRVDFTEHKTDDTGNLIRIKNKKYTMNAEPAAGVFMETYLDVGKRLDGIPTKYLKLLFDYYILKISANEIASKAKIDASAIGGRISQARKALKKALGGLIPGCGKNSNPLARAVFTPQTHQELLIERRAKVARFLNKKINQTKNKD